MTLLLRWSLTVFQIFSQADPSPLLRSRWWGAFNCRWKKLCHHGWAIPCPRCCRPSAPVWWSPTYPGQIPVSLPGTRFPYPSAPWRRPETLKRTRRSGSWRCRPSSPCPPSWAPPTGARNQDGCARFSGPPQSSRTFWSSTLSGCWPTGPPRRSPGSRTLRPSPGFWWRPSSTRDTTVWKLQVGVL